MRYPKAFEDYWARADTYVSGQEAYAAAQVKRIAFRAWMNGRRQPPLAKRQKETPI